MTNKELMAEILRSNMDSEAKSEIIDLVYSKREEKVETEKAKIRKKRISEEKPEGIEERRLP